MVNVAHSLPISICYVVNINLWGADSNVSTMETYGKENDALF